MLHSLICFTLVHGLSVEAIAVSSASLNGKSDALSGISKTSPAQLAASVRKSTLDRPFILPILSLGVVI
ncbi:MAG: hypothetical protein HN551_01415 [Tateyamaria sp.]|nr:hypothetical protein [Tateyamaria sp.]MBT5303407.1 hypothetical protein [Tateyamaria sp.]MBT7799892.1 hypothetical protein [Tateyamaria sp.]